MLATCRQWVRSCLRESIYFARASFSRYPSHGTSSRSQHMPCTQSTYTRLALIAHALTCFARASFSDVSADATAGRLRRPPKRRKSWNTCTVKPKHTGAFESAYKAELYSELRCAKTMLCT
eukprot:scaffold8254_cov21-Tisochrysis_lutea.AAC.1